MGSVNFSNALGIHENALHLRARRAEVLANNLANADTPGFKARDLDFASLLNGARESAAAPQRTHSKHLSLDGGNGTSELLYRTPTQPSIDGNTVEEQPEMARFAKNAVDYEASFYFLSSKFRGLRNAIKGEA